MILLYSLFFEYLCVSLRAGLSAANPHARLHASAFYSGFSATIPHSVSVRKNDKHMTKILSNPYLVFIPLRYSDEDK